MVLDPLTAFSVAGTVIQFVDFGTKIFSRSNQLYKSVDGALSVNKELEDISTDLLKLMVKLSRPLHVEGAGGDGTEDEQALERLCDNCGNLAQEMLTRLESLKVRGKHKKWKSFGLALRVAFTQGEIDGISGRLALYGNALKTRILVSLRENIDLLSLRLSKRFGDVDDQSRQIITALMASKTDSKKDLDAQTMAITQMLNRTEIVIVDKTRKMIVDAIRNGGLPENSENNTFSLPERQDIEKLQRDERDIRIAVENSLLENLEFSTMTERQQAVDVAHGKTFEWIFDTSSPRSTTWSSLVEWLNYGSGIYWISGKAGSGKTTLMRYICEHAQTQLLLNSWAAPLRPSTSKFFFWNSGAVEQRSQSGFLRSVLSEVLTKHKELIPIVLPGQWANEYSRLVNHLTRNEAIYWSLPALIQAFRLLVTQVTVQLKLCLFIDGLDEYDGDNEEIAALFQTITSSVNIKVCVSSRPLLVFEDAFRSYRGLRLQDLTFQDIKHYVSDKLGKNPRFRMLALNEPNKAPALVNEIVTKADGVFLWVKLVVKSLLTGLGNRDSVSDLLKRLKLLPSDLEALYAHMLTRIEPFYETKASEMFQLVRAARALNTIHDLGESSEGLTILALALAEEEDNFLAISAQIKTPSTVDISNICEVMADRLKCRCAGLLEVQGRDRAARALPGTPKLDHIRPDAKVQYLHRTAKDYVERTDVWSIIVARTCGTNFNPHTSLLRSYVFQLNTCGTSRSEYKLWQMALDAMAHARYAAIETGNANISLLDQLDETMKNSYKIQYGGHWSSHSPVSDNHYLAETWNSSFLSFAVQCGLSTYVHEKLEGEASVYTAKKGRPLLEYVLSPFPIQENYFACVKTVVILLEKGAEPTNIYNGKAAWAKSLDWQHQKFDSMESRSQKPDKEWMAARLAIFEVLMKHDEDPQVPLLARKPSPQAITELFRPWVPVEDAALLQIQRFQTHIEVEQEASNVHVTSTERQNNPTAQHRTFTFTKFRAWVRKRSKQG